MKTKQRLNTSTFKYMLLAKTEEIQNVFSHDQSENITVFYVAVS